MPAYVHINLRVLDESRQMALTSRFQKALALAGGRMLHFGQVAHVLEGDLSPLPMAGILEFPSVEQALAFYESPEYAPVKAERLEVQEARIFIVDAG